MAQDFVRNKKGSYFCVCDCKCGKEHWVLAASLKRGSTASCGCSKARYEKTRGQQSKQYTGYKEIPGKCWGDIQRKAAVREIPFDITIEEGYEIYQKQNSKCALTGLLISFGNTRLKTTASLDRISSDDKYRSGNVQWVHKDVNIMKNVFSVERFVEICRLVTQEHEVVK